MGLRRILVNRGAVERNAAGSNDPVFTVVDDQGTQHYGSNIILTGMSELKYDPSGCVGSRIWIETWDKVILKYESDSEPPRPTLVGI